MKKVILSIIVVSLNTKLDFIRTLNSIFKQSFKNYELIVVDGKSIDGTIEEIYKRKKKMSKIVIEKDQGIYDAMNKGIKLVSGRWVIFLNSGDIFYNKNVLKNIFKKKIESKDIVYGNSLVKNINLKYYVKAKKFSKKTIIMPFCHQSTMTKSNILKQNNFSLKYKCSSDFNFFLYCFIKKKKFFNVNLNFATVSANGLADKNRQKVFDENIQILNNYNYNYNLILRIMLLKLINYIKDIIKFFLPTFLIKKILKIKYNINNI